MNHSPYEPPPIQPSIWETLDPHGKGKYAVSGEAAIAHLECVKILTMLVSKPRKRLHVKNPFEAASRVLATPGCMNVLMLLISLCQESPSPELRKFFGIESEGTRWRFRFLEPGLHRLLKIEPKVTLRALRMAQRHGAITSFRRKHGKITIDCDLRVLDGFIFMGYFRTCAFEDHMETPVFQRALSGNYSLIAGFSPFKSPWTITPDSVARNKRELFSTSFPGSGNSGTAKPASQPIPGNFAPHPSSCALSAMELHSHLVKEEILSDYARDHSGKSAPTPGGADFESDEYKQWLHQEKTRRMLARQPPPPESKASNTPPASVWPDNTNNITWG